MGEINHPKSKFVTAFNEAKIKMFFFVDFKGL